MAIINDFILGKGWGYTGVCGCQIPMDKYVNKDHKGYEIRLGKNGKDNFEIRHEGITRKQGRGIDQLTTVYNLTFKP